MHDSDRQPPRVEDTELAPELDEGSPGANTCETDCLDDDFEPWPEPVDGASLLDELRGRVNRLIVLPGGGAEALGLWALGTHAFDAFDLFPRLLLTSPQKRCGKSRALAVLRLTCSHALLASNVTPAAVYGAIEAWRPTLLIDEADTFIAHNEALRGVLNSGHSRHAAFVLRARAPGLKPVRASTWAPLAIAMIGKPPATVLDRSIAIELRRRLRTERVERLDPREAAEWAVTLRRRAARWAADAASALRAARPERLAGLDDRAGDNWEPLLAIADFVGGTWPRVARDAAAALSRSRDDDEDPGVLLLADLRAFFLELARTGPPRERAALRVSTTRILESLHRREDRPWRTAQHGRPLGPDGLARLLEPFGVRPQTIRSGRESVVKGYKVEGFEDTFARYLPPSMPDLAVTSLRCDTTRGCGDTLAAGDACKSAGDNNVTM